MKREKGKEKDLESEEAGRITGRGGKKMGKSKTNNNRDPNFTALNHFVLLFIQIISYQQWICTLLPTPFFVLCEADTKQRS